MKVEIKIFKAGFFLFCFALTQSLHVHAQNIVTVQGSGKVYVQANANAYVHGGLLFQNGSALSNSGTITVKEIGNAGASNWTDESSTPYFHGNGTVVFNGTGGHTAASPNTFGKIHVNTSGHLTQGSDLNTNTILLDNGRVNTTSSYKMIVLTTPANAADNSANNSGFANSWVDGMLRRYIAPATVNQYVFPLGNTTRSNIAMLDALTAQPVNNVNYVDACLAPSREPMQI